MRLSSESLGLGYFPVVNKFASMSSRVTLEEWSSRVAQWADFIGQRSKQTDSSSTFYDRLISIQSLSIRFKLFSMIVDIFASSN